jgi:phospholipid transport system transporter-binding protein
MADGATDAAVAAAGPGRASVAGPLTFESVGLLAKRGAGLLSSQDGQRLEVDLEGVSDVDSAGLALLIGWLADARAAGISLSYRSVPDRLLAIARISDIDGLLTGEALPKSV